MPTYSPDIATGGRAVLLIGGVDVNCRMWKVSKKFTNEVITTTGDTDPTTGLSYERKITAGISDDISFDAYVDMNNDVLATLEAGNAEIENVVVTFRAGKTRTYPLILLDSIELDSGGVLGANKYAVKASSQGPYTVT